MGSERHRKRLKHYDVSGDAHFLTFSCYHRYELLSKERTRLWFVEALGQARSKHDFDLWAWVIMPEHAHLLIYPRRPVYKTSTILASIKRPVGSKAIQFLKENSPEFLQRLTVVNKNRTYHRCWQPGAGFDKNLDEVSAIYEVIDYIHYNPVRRGLVDRPIDWFWSSARDWAGMGHPRITVDRTVPILHPTG
jgi:putative transposase